MKTTRNPERGRAAMYRRCTTNALAAMLLWCVLSCAAAAAGPAAGIAASDACANARDRDRCEAQRAAVESCRGESAATLGDCIARHLPPATAAAALAKPSNTPGARGAPNQASAAERCANRPNAAACEARMAAEEACREVPSSARSACVRENMPPPKPLCETSRDAPTKARCEISRTATLPCMDLRGAAARECIAAKRPSLKNPRFNGLDCANAGPALAERCAYREIVLAGCAALSAADAGKCRLEYLPFTTELRHCDSDTRKGSCLLHNRVLGNCRGMQGTALDLCLSREVRTRYASVVNCSPSDANAVEKQYCAKYDEALGACMNEFDVPERYTTCVTRTIPRALTLAAQALQPLRLGVPH